MVPVAALKLNADSDKDFVTLVSCKLILTPLIFPEGLSKIFNIPYLSINISTG